ncbi:cyclic nucleotide-binding and patatin-like phospholipase domain-containing protein [Pirellulales bacterium]|nr:cyclic nucleotide-binding and patatin-like phospholipase domain-containing protein [Pirellulales bacterium]
MSVTQDKLLLFKSHEYSRGLSDETLQEISDAAELVQFDAGEHIHRANQAMESVYLVVHGRLKQTVVDMHGNVLLRRFLTPGSQFGLLGAAQAEPVPIDVVAAEHSAVLKLDFETTLRFTRQHEIFGLNLTRSISNMVSQVLLSDRQLKKPPFVAVFHQSAASRPLTRKLIQRLLELGESPCLMSDQVDWEPIEGVSYRAIIEDGQFLQREDIRRQINQWSESGRVFLDVDASLDPVNASLIVEFSEQVIWCTSREEVESSVYRLKAIEARAPGWRDKINLVWMLDEDEQVAPRAAKLNKLVERDFKISISDPRPGLGRTLLNGFERLVHQLRGVRIGLALGGGGARGMAHLGVLNALEESGIVVDMIAGTSAGAMTGVLYAAGHDADYLAQSFVEDLKPGWPFRMLPHGDDWHLLYKYRRGHFDWMLRRYLQDWTLEQLPVPVQSVTVDLVTGKPVVRDRGDAANSILESINLPVLSKPIRRNGQALVDGGLVNNIPADILARNGCNFVIAVSVTAHLEAKFAKNRPDTPTSEMSSASTLQTLLRSYLVQNVNMNSIGVQPADIVIEPDVTEFGMTEFSRADELAAVGEAAARQELPNIQHLLKQLDAELF